MNHAFQSSGGDSNNCIHCKFPYITHTDKAECECCPNIGPVEIRYGNMLMCAECWAKEQRVQAEHQSPEAQQARVNNYRERISEQQRLLDEARRIDSSIQVRTNLFNAATVSIVDLKKIIDSNEAITNKPYAFAEELMKRFTHYKQVVFELNEQLLEAGNQQKAIQVYLNNLANQLRAEEREKLKIADINYKPGTVRPIKPKSITTTSSTTGVRKSKIDKIALKKFAIELGISEFMLQQVVIAKGVTVENAAKIIKASIEAAMKIQQ